MNKTFSDRKGEGISVSYIIAGVLAVVILVAVIISLYAFFTGTANPIFSFLPDFDEDKLSLENIELVRYDIIENGVQYYDGKNWIDFSEKNVEFSDRDVDGKEITGIFRSYYFDSKRESPEEIELGITAENVFYFDYSDVFLAGMPKLHGEINGIDRGEGGFYRAKSSFFGSKIEDKFLQGDVIIYVKSEDNVVREDGFGIFSLRADNTLLFKRLEESESVEEAELSFEFKEIKNLEGDYKKISDAGKEWRDSILKNSLVFQSENYCVEKRSKYLHMNLKVPISSAESCNV